MIKKWPIWLYKNTYNKSKGEPNSSSMYKSEVDKKRVSKYNKLEWGKKPICRDSRSSINIRDQKEALDVTTKGINLGGFNDNAFICDPSKIFRIHLMLSIYAYLWL